MMNVETQHPSTRMQDGRQGRRAAADGIKHGMQIIFTPYECDAHTRQINSVIPGRTRSLSERRTKLITTHTPIKVIEAHGDAVRVYETLNIIRFVLARQEGYKDEVRRS